MLMWTAISCFHIILPAHWKSVINGLNVMEKRWNSSAFTYFFWIVYVIQCIWNPTKINMEILSNLRQPVVLVCAMVNWWHMYRCRVCTYRKLQYILPATLLSTVIACSERLSNSCRSKRGLFCKECNYEAV